MTVADKVEAAMNEQQQAEMDAEDRQFIARRVQKMVAGIIRFYEDNAALQL